MIVLLSALAIAMTQAPTAQPSAPATGDDPAPSLQQLQQLYDQSCANREFGAYDDMCDQLRKQVRAAQAEAARQARQRPTRPKPAATPPANTTGPA